MIKYVKEYGVFKTNAWQLVSLLLLLSFIESMMKQMN